MTEHHVTTGGGGSANGHIARVRGHVALEIEVARIRGRPVESQAAAPGECAFQSEILRKIAAALGDAAGRVDLDGRAARQSLELRAVGRPAVESASVEDHLGPERPVLHRRVPSAVGLIDAEGAARSGFDDPAGAGEQVGRGRAGVELQRAGGDVQGCAVRCDLATGVVPLPGARARLGHGGAGGREVGAPDERFARRHGDARGAADEGDSGGVGGERVNVVGRDLVEIVGGGCRQGHGQGVHAPGQHQIGGTVVLWSGRVVIGSQSARGRGVAPQNSGLCPIAGAAGRCGGVSVGVPIPVNGGGRAGEGDKQASDEWAGESGFHGVGLEVDAGGRGEAVKVWNGNEGPDFHASHRSGPHGRRRFLESSPTRNGWGRPVECPSDRVTVSGNFPPAMLLASNRYTFSPRRERRLPSPVESPLPGSASKPLMP